MCLDIMLLLFFKVRLHSKRLAMPHVANLKGSANIFFFFKLWFNRWEMEKKKHSSSKWYDSVRKRRGILKNGQTFPLFDFGQISLLLCDCNKNSRNATVARTHTCSHPAHRHDVSQLTARVYPQKLLHKYPGHACGVLNCCLRSS